MVSRPHGSTEGSSPESPAPDGRSQGEEALKHIPALLEELREYGTHYVSARTDAISARLRELTAGTVLGLMGLLALAAVIAVSVVLLLNGVATGLGQLFGGRVWLGQLVTGLAVLVLLVVATWIGLRRWQRTSREQTIAKYEQRKTDQRSRFNRSVEHRAAGSGGS